MELGPLVNDEIVSYLEEAGGAALRDKFLNGPSRMLDTAVFPADRSTPEIREAWRAMPSWWGNPVSDSHDRATAHVPKLLYERLDEFGIDYMLAYPSWSLGMLDTRDDELRAPMLRAVNRHVSGLFTPYADRLSSAALIPMATPDEAVAELRYAVETLGFKSIVIAGHAIRKLTDDPRDQAYRLDTFGIDSEYDYDPFWAACLELGITPVTHSSLQAHRITRSRTNYVFNHIGGLAVSHYELAKSLVMGGVFKRFPELRIGFLEGGVAWAVSLLADLIGHWDKRNAGAIGSLDPAVLDVDALVDTIGQYGDDRVLKNLDRIRADFSRTPGRPAELDEFSAAGFTTVDEIISLFSDRMYFGCEADDPLVGWASGTVIKHRPVNLRPILGTDISHWDAPVMNEVIVEAFELLEDKVIDEDAFKAFTFGNPVSLHKAANKDFFVGTVCEQAAAAV
ncbi:MAG: putative metal-dependent hydrolase, TIM-barrel fold, partial [Mycobacterium sp.]|nr:putative metal-dependent hydrolase, TIM-barrel fold [Mycobacterium sp.]